MQPGLFGGRINGTMPDENIPTPEAGNEPGNPQNPPLPAPAPGAPVQAPPPAAFLVSHGEVKSERELELERQLAETEANKDREAREMQTRIAELERDKQNLLSPTPVPIKQKKGRLFPTVIKFDSDDE